MLDAICANAADLHWARMQEHDVLYADPDWNVLYLGDAAHNMVPTLGQGAAQAIEDATVAADIIAEEWESGQHAPRRWLRRIARARAERMRFAMRLALETTETMREGADPAADALQKQKPAFLARLRRLYCDVWPAETGTPSMPGFREVAVGGLVA
jgi:salicylate hydroxylase